MLDVRDLPAFLGLGRGGFGGSLCGLVLFACPLGVGGEVGQRCGPCGHVPVIAADCCGVQVDQRPVYRIGEHGPAQCLLGGTHTVASGDSAPLGIDWRLPPALPPASPSFETVLRAVEFEASQIAAAEQDTRDAA
jgi:hypothetical protein